MLSKDELNAIEDRASRATPGPWSMKQDGAEFYIADRNGRWLDVTLSDAIFISHARQDIPALLAEVERLRAALENLSKRDNYYYNGSELIFIDPDTGDYMDVEHYAKKILKGGSQ